MAKTTVEILGGQLDGAILENAASEETLKQLVAAISGGSGYSASGGGASSMVGRTPAGMIAGGVVGAIGSSIKGAVNQIGNVAGTTGAFAGMLLKGQGNLSAYTKTLNEQVIKQIPVFGKYLGAVGGAVTGTVQEFERWNKTLQSLTASGATFNNSIIQMMHASTKSYLTLDQFSDLVSKNSATMRILGETVTQGAQAFSDYSYAVLNASGPARKTLISMGYTIPQINDQLVRFLDVNYRGTRQDQINETQVANSFVEYQTHLHRLTTLTGKRSDQLEQEMESARNDAAFQLRLAQYPVEIRAQLNQQLAAFTAMHGAGAAELFKARFLGLNPMTDNAGLMNMMFPNLISEIDNSIAQAQQGGQTLEQRNSETANLMVRLLRSGANSIQEFRPLLEAAGVGANELDGVANASATMAQNLARMGIDIENVSDDELHALVQAQMDEMNQRETFTQILRQFQTAMGDFRVAFFETLMKPGGPLNEFSKMMEEQHLDTKIRELGVTMGNFVREYLPDVVTFFAGFATDPGRQLFKEQIGYLFETVGAYFMNYLPRLMGIDIDPQMLQSDLQNIRNRYDPIFQNLNRSRDIAVDEMLSRPNRGEGAVADTGGQDLSNLTPQERMAIQVYRSFIAQGLPDDVARALTAEVARENAFNPDLIFGSHSDPYNNVENVGMISWQGARRTAFLDWMTSGGFIGSDGRIVRSQASLNHQAAFLVNEIQNNPSYQATEDYIGGANRTFEGLHDVLGRNYIRWRIDDPNYRSSGFNNIRGGYNILNRGLGSLNPDEMRAGSLGAYGSLFADMGGKEVEVHNEEAIVSPGQLTSEMMSSAEDSYAGVNDLNQKLSALIALTQQRLDISERLAEKMATNSNKLYA